MGRRKQPTVVDPPNVLALVAAVRATDQRARDEAFAVLFAHYADLLKSITSSAFPKKDFDVGWNEAMHATWYAVQRFEPGRGPNLGGFIGYCVKFRLLTLRYHGQWRRDVIGRTRGGHHHVSIDATFDGDDEQDAFHPQYHDHGFELVDDRDELETLGVPILRDAKLSPLERDALVWKIGEGFTYDQAAERIGRSKRAIDNALIRGQKKIAKARRGD